MLPVSGCRLLPPVLLPSCLPPELLPSCLPQLLVAAAAWLLLRRRCVWPPQLLHLLVLLWLPLRCRLPVLSRLRCCLPLWLLLLLRC